MQRLLAQLASAVRVPWSEGTSGDWVPSTDVGETDAEYTIRAALPAVKKEDIHVTVSQGVLTIKGERKQQEETKNEKFHRLETLFGSFERSFAVPENANEDAITSESKDGVLTIHIPKVPLAPATAKEVTIQ
jgi:HSP20 family protein